MIDGGAGPDHYAARTLLCGKLRKMDPCMSRIGVLNEPIDLMDCSTDWLGGSFGALGSHDQDRLLVLIRARCNR